MSDTPQGPGWWQASDGRYYPPESAPGTWATPQPAAQLPSTETSGKATAALVSAILSWVVCPVIPAVVALVLAGQARRDIEDSYGRRTGEGLVSASRIIAILNIALTVLVVPLLLAVAIPTFRGAQDRAWERSTQSELRRALAAERQYFTDNGAWTDEPTELRLRAPGLQFEPGDLPFRQGVLYVVVEDELLGLAAKSRSGDCFYLMANATEFSDGYAEDPTCGPVQSQNYTDSWP